MKFSENWLRTWVASPQMGQALADSLTMAGLEVEALEIAGPAFSGVVVGRVLSVEKHPDADRLKVCQVEVGGEAPLTIVCGAPNVVVGARVPCALVGACLPADESGKAIEIRRAKVRGVESSGMLCSAKELGIAEESSGLMMLADDAVPGTSIRDYLDLDDRLITLKLTPNRADCLSMAGIAREVSALTDTPTMHPDVSPVAAQIPDHLSIHVADAVSCPRYSGRIIRGLRADAKSPDWLVRRLERAGLRAKHPIVDVTNYVMLELGQPLHAFDLAAIEGGIEVRRAKDQEQLSLLNGSDVVLADDFLVVADARKALAIAGVMGGANSAVTEGRTTDIFLESAFFAPGIVAGRARRLGLASDAAYRFERGVDPCLTRDAIERATRLLLEIAGGQAGPVVEQGGAPSARKPLRLRLDRVARLIGMPIDTQVALGILQRLGFAIQARDEAFTVTPPSWRFDVSGEADLIEEIARMIGYDRIPAITPQAGLSMLPQPEGVRPLALIRQTLVARDWQEVINYSFVDAAWEAAFADNTAPVTLQNPIASQMGVMRSTLFGGLVNCLVTNLNRKQDRVRIFEIGRVFTGQSPDFLQPQKLGGLAYGGVRPEQWGDAARTVDFYDVKADIEVLLRGLPVRFEAAQHPALHPTQSARILINGVPAGWLGSLHPKWQQQYELPQAPVMFELELEWLQKVLIPQAEEISRFQLVRRDLAVVVDESQPASALLDAMLEAAVPHVVEIGLFDVYRGKGIEAGKKSLAFRVLMQDTQKTLKDAEADMAMALLTALVAEKFGAALRA